MIQCAIQFDSTQYHVSNLYVVCVGKQTGNMIEMMMYREDATATAFRIIMTATTYAEYLHEVLLY